MLDRRAFLRRLGFGTVAAAAAANGLIDVEKLLWTPGEKTIFIPPAIVPATTSFTVGDMFTIEGVYAVNPMTQRTMDCLQYFVITADVESGHVVPMNLVYPPIRTDGPYRNASASPSVRGHIPGDKMHPVIVEYVRPELALRVES